LQSTFPKYIHIHYLIQSLEDPRAGEVSFSPFYRRTKETPHPYPQGFSCLPMLAVAESGRARTLPCPLCLADGQVFLPTCLPRAWQAGSRKTWRS
jgi:hypothetical protein